MAIKKQPCEPAWFAGACAGLAARTAAKLLNTRTETDAHFQLGRIARAQERLADALRHFQTVLDQNERHSQSEVLRELGGMYIRVRQYEDARHMLADHVERRPYDPKGLYYYGQALEGLGRNFEAREMYVRAVEADRTAPRYRRRFTAQWSRLAQKSLGSLRKHF